MDITVVSFILLLMVVLAILSIVFIALLVRSHRRKAQAAGYATLGEYLRAAPRSEEEKRDAVDLMLKGVVICLLGLALPPLLLVGVFPFFFGARKVVYAQMGFGLFEDADPPSR
jgi:hypothetical protein